MVKTKFEAYQPVKRFRLDSFAEQKIFVQKRIIEVTLKESNVDNMSSSHFKMLQFHLCNILKCELHHDACIK